MNQGFSVSHMNGNRFKEAYSIVEEFQKTP